MTTRAGVGFSQDAISFAAGRTAAAAALADGNLSGCDLALVYFTSKHDPCSLRDGIRSVIGRDARLLGGHAVGAFTRDRLGYEGYEVGLAAIASNGMAADMFIENDIAGRERDAGRSLGRQLLAAGHGADANLLLMYDSVSTATGADSPKLNLATPLIAGMSETIGAWPRTAGVGMIGDMQWSNSVHLFGDAVGHEAAMALALTGTVRMDSIIMHGCEPASGYHTITRVDGCTVLELDGRPAIEAIAALLGPDRTWETYPLFVTLGVNRGDKFGPFREEDYANRLCMAVDKARGGLVMFENDLREGDEVQLMHRSINCDHVMRRAEQLLACIGDRVPFFALYIDCAGRATAYSGVEEEDASPVQQVIGSKMPMLGMYSGVEIAQVGGMMQPLDWTGVLCIFSEPR